MLPLALTSVPQTKTPSALHVSLRLPWRMLPLVVAGEFLAGLSGALPLMVSPNYSQEVDL